MSEISDFGLVLEVNLLENVSFNLQRVRIIHLFTFLTEFVHNHQNEVSLHDMWRVCNDLAIRLNNILRDEYNPKDSANSVESINAEIMAIVEACNSLKPRF